MRKITSISSVAAPIAEADIDTDVILPARFLLLMDRKGLGRHLFHEHRKNTVDADPFVLDEPAYAGTKIIVAGKRFGVGSSREQAVWSLVEFGIECIIAESFGEIFQANCINNAVLPITLTGDEHARVMRAAQSAAIIQVDLEQNFIRLPYGTAIAIEINSNDRAALLSGRDELEGILKEDSEDISSFERAQKKHSPWFYLGNDQISTFGNQ